MGSVNHSPTSRLEVTNLLKLPTVTTYATRRGGRVVDGTGLENRRGATHRGFESLPLRHRNKPGL